jgi:rhomboid protease GluP
LTASPLAERTAGSGVTLGPSSYPVRFKRFATVVKNEYGLGGRGEIAFESDTVIVRGKRGWPLLGRPIELRVPRATVLDATRHGRLIWFHERDTATSRPKRMVLHADTARDAEAIHAALPAALSPARAQARAEADDFVEKLYDITPRVWVTPTLIWLNIALFALLALAGAGLFTPEPTVHVRWGSNYGPLTANGQWWRLLTNVFLHFGVLHVALNMWALRDAGYLGERLLGNAPFLVTYLVAGVVGSVASLAWNANVNSAGASGAVFGVYGALLAYALNPRNGVPITVMKEMRFSLLVFLGYAVVVGVYVKLIDNAAHIGGFVAGVVAALALGRPLDRARRGGGRRTRVMVAALLLALVAIAGARWSIGQAFAHFEEQRFRQIVPAFAAQGRRLDAIEQRVLAAVRAGLIPRDKAAEVFGEQAERWRGLERDLLGVGLAPSSAFEPVRAKLVRLAETRARANDLLAAGLPGGEDKTLRDVSELYSVARNLEREIEQLIRGLVADVDKDGQAEDAPKPPATRP